MEAPVFALSEPAVFWPFGRRLIVSNFYARVFSLSMQSNPISTMLNRLRTCDTTLLLS